MVNFKVILPLPPTFISVFPSPSQGESDFAKALAEPSFTFPYLPYPRGNLILLKLWPNLRKKLKLKKNEVIKDVPQFDRDKLDRGELQDQARESPLAPQGGRPAALLDHRHMVRGGYGLPKVSPGPAMPDPSTPCRWATPEMAFWSFQGWSPAGQAVCGCLLALWTPHTACR